MSQILIDTNIWIEHLETNLLDLREILFKESVCTHTLIIQELSCGKFSDRQRVMETLQLLPAFEITPHEDILKFIRLKSLAGRGLGVVDTHLLFACNAHHLSLWSRDKNLIREAKRIGIKVLN